MFIALHMSKLPLLRKSHDSSVDEVCRLMVANVMISWNEGTESGQWTVSSWKLSAFNKNVAWRSRWHVSKIVQKGMSFILEYEVLICINSLNQTYMHRNTRTHTRTHAHTADEQYLLHVSAIHGCHHQGIFPVVKVVLSKW